jgi:non-specific serine/threonine protein kinase
MAARRAAAPIVMASLELGDDGETLSEYLRETVRRILQTAPGARLACVNIIKTSRLRIDSALDDQGRNLHVRRLVEIRQWAKDLDLPPEQVTAHVLEASDPAAALIDFARTNHVDQIVMGARSATAMRRSIGSVAARVGALAPCTVTLVRLPEQAELELAAGNELTEPAEGFGL